MELFTTEELRSIRNSMGEKAAAELRKNHNKPTEKYLYYVNIEKKAQNEVMRRNSIVPLKQYEELTDAQKESAREAFPDDYDDPKYVYKTAGVNISFRAY